MDLLEAHAADAPTPAAASRAMSEWQVQPAQARKERQANKKPAWRVAADHAWERSGARFMMQQLAEKEDPPPYLLLVVLTGLPGSGKSLLAAQLRARGFSLVCQDSRWDQDKRARTP